MPRNILLEMGGGGANNQEYVRKKGGEYQAYVCVRGRRGGQILANLERTYYLNDPKIGSPL